MLRRIKSALFIDFENLQLSADSIDRWLAWLEDGEFDGGKRRRFIVKRVFWNSSAQLYDRLYKSHGFDVVLCDRYHGLENSADVQMAIDIIETTYQMPAIEEYIIISRDTDFVPVLKRLRERDKKTVFLVNEHKLNPYTTYRNHADVLIPVRELASATSYVRPNGGLLNKLGRALGRKRKVDRAAEASPAPPQPRKGKATTAPPPAVAAKVPPAQVQAQVQVPAKPSLSLDEAKDRALAQVVAALSRKPNNPIARTKIIDALRGIPGFTSTGKDPFFGTGSFKQFMQYLANRDPRITLTVTPEGGLTVKFVPAAEKKSAASAFDAPQVVVADPAPKPQIAAKAIDAVSVDSPARTEQH